MSEPYYQDDLVTLYHGDSSEITAWLDANILVTDPPYGINYQSGARRLEGNARSIVGDANTEVRDNILAAWRDHAGWSDRPALIFGTWRIDRPAGTHTRLIWDTKGALGMGNLSVPWKPSDQEIYVIGYGFSGPRTTNVLRHAPVQSKGRLHPHEKPLGLMLDLLGKCLDGWTIADPCSGSGSTLVAAKMLGLPAVGIEIEERYCEATAKRLAQDTLFGGAA